MIDQQPTANDNEVERQEANEKPSSAKKARNRKNRVNKKSTKKSKISAADQPPKRPLLAYNIYLYVSWWNRFWNPSLLLVMTDNFCSLCVS